ncbi:MAG: F0F1 ATP synthase subunit B [Bauldia sp.]|nr:F0F1 ATP synthase subunit B [Bauldia sp.]
MFADPAFWALVGLIIFFVVLVYLKVPGVLTSGLDKRADTIRNELDQARKLREEAEALLAEYRKKAREAEGEAAAIVDQAKREAEALTVEARRRMEEYVAGRTRLAEQKIAQAEAQAVQEVRALSADVAIAAAEKILAARVKGDAGAALIDKAIGDVKSKLN